MRRLKISTVPALSAAAAIAIIIGCGGGGGGGGSSTDGSTTGLTSVAIEARDADQFAADLLTVQVGDTLNLRLWGRDSSNQIGFEFPTDWSTNAPASVATLTPDGILQAVGASSTVYTVSARGGAYTASLRVRPTGAILRGSLRNTESVGVPGAISRIYNAGGDQLASTVTGSNGSFRLQVPLNSREFLIDTTPIKDRYYNQFGFGDKEYSIICPANKPSTPTPVSGGTVTLSGTPVVYRKVSGSTPPPPPPGCGL